MCGTSEPRNPLRDGERIDDLQCGGYRLIQRRDAFRFGTDSVLLADFASPRPRSRAADLCAGTGAIATLMAAHVPTLAVDAVEIQPDIADMARRSAEMNGLAQRVRVFAMDLRDAPSALGHGVYALVTCNPPYHRSGAALPSAREGVRIARHEGDLEPGDLALSASKLLQNGGRFAVVYPAPRALEMMRAMEDCGIAPKRVRTVHGMPGRPPKLILLDGVRGGGSGLHWLPPLLLRNADGSFTGEWRRIYRVP